MSSTPHPEPGETLAGMIARLIGQEIISGRLRPGVRLEEPALADRYEISRTPVREAIRLLSATGLVGIRPHRGAFVAEVTHAQIAERFELMAELEALCAGFAAIRMTQEERHALESIHVSAIELVHNQDREAYRLHNSDFHNRIYAGAHNDALAQATRSVRTTVSAFRAAQFGLEPRLAGSQAEHDLILSRLLARDAEGAKEVMREHITTVRDAVVNYLNTVQPIQI